MKKLFLLVGLGLVLGSAGLASAGVLFEDDFEDGNLDGWSVIANPADNVVGSWSVENGSAQFHRDPSLEGGGCLMADGLWMPDSYTLEFDARMVTVSTTPGSDHLIAYMNFADWDNYLDGCFRQNPPGYDHLIFVEEINGVRQPGQTSSYLVFLPFSTDEFQWHHHKYVRDGDSVSFYFDGVFRYTTPLPLPITGGRLVLFATEGTHQFDNVRVTTPEPEPLELELDLTEFFITKHKRTGLTTTAIFGFIDDFPDLFVGDGDPVQCRITIELFDVLEDGGNLVISNESELTVNDRARFFVIRK